MAAAKRAPTTACALWLPRALCTVLGYNLLATLTLLPLPAVAFWALARLQLPVSAVCAVAYFSVEVAAFCAERNWSRAGLCSFWQSALPLCALQGACCLLLCRRDALGCVLISCGCLGLREALFEFLHASASVLGYCRRDRLAAAALGGLTLSALAALGCSASAMLFCLVQGSPERLSPLAQPLLFLGFLPALRALLRMLVTWLTSSLALGSNLKCAELDPMSSRAEAANGGGGVVLLDALVLGADLAFALTALLELPFVMALLLAPEPWLCGGAAALHGLCDVLLCCSADALQRRGGGGSLGASQAASGWAPSYLQERPVGLVATVLAGGGAPAEPLEEQRLSSGRVSERYSSGWDYPSPCSSPHGRPGCPPAPRAASPLTMLKDLCAARRREEPPRRSPMSPRVSRILDDYDAALLALEAKDGSAAAGGSLAGQRLCRLQEMGQSFAAQLLGCTLALAMALACAPALRLRPTAAEELLGRGLLLASARLLADLSAAWLLDYTGALGRLGRQELSSFHGWLFRALVALLPVFPILAATAAGCRPPEPRGLMVP